MTPRTCAAMVRRVDELNGFLKGVKRDDSPAARTEVAELNAALRVAAKRTMLEERFRLRLLFRRVRARRVRVEGDWA